ncbi:MAG: protein kinase [Proteobacteria bacterium]|nr:protein kinase [Pseudomonadota bacterium]
MALQVSDIATLSRLLDEVLSLQPAERAAWLDGLPEAHRHVVPVLREMLAEADATGARLATLPRLEREEAGAHAGERVGAYRLIRQIGHGGMGSVWLAERADGSFERRIALKLPRLAWMEGLAARMARERRIGALLEHPQIARLYDAGVDDLGRPYIAMEYIEGVQIDVYCQQHALSIRRRLELHLQVIRAVAYAHGRLVVHRDLKPANVLVDGQGQAHLLDFGIAKLLDDASNELTQEQGRALTPSYAAPEQIAGQPVGVAADIYSLGVMLYRLLTGELPYDSGRATPAALEEAILAGSAPVMSSRVRGRLEARQLRGELDAIVGKAMKGAVSQRYTTADAMGEDIERYLKGETVRAQPDSAWYRVRKAAFRYRLAIAAATAILLAAGIGGGATFMEAQRTARQQERATIATQFVSEMFRVDLAATFSGAREESPEAGQFADRTTNLIEARFAGQPDLQAELYGAAGRTYLDIGAGKFAFKCATRQMELLRQLSADRVSQSRSLLLLADANRAEGRVSEAEANARSAIALVDIDTAAGVESRAKLANLLIEAGKIAEARSTVETIERDASAGVRTVGAAAGLLLTAKAELMVRDNRFDEALPIFEEAIERVVAAEGSDSRLAIRLRSDLAFRLLYRHRVDEGTGLIDLALKALNASGDTGRMQAAVVTASFWTSLYLAAPAVSYAETVATIERARSQLDRWRLVLPPGIIGYVDFQLGWLHLVRGDLGRADPLIRAAAPVVAAATDTVFGRYEVAATLGAEAMFAGRTAEADVQLRRALSIRSEMGESTYPFTALDWCYVALNLVMSGDTGAAERFISLAPAFGDMKGDAVMGIYYAQVVGIVRARILLERGQPAKAMEVLPKPYSSGYRRPTGLELGSSPLSGEILCKGGKAEAGLPILLTTIGLEEPLRAPQDPSLARFRAVAGLCALEAGRLKQARQFADLSRRAFTLQPGVNPWFKAPLIELERVLRVPHGPARTHGLPSRRDAARAVQLALGLCRASAGSMPACAIGQ